MAEFGLLLEFSVGMDIIASAWRIISTRDDDDDDMSVKQELYNISIHSFIRTCFILAGF